MDERARERLASLPPSAKLVYYVLDAEGRLDQTGLAAETRLSTRTVRFAVEKLSAAELVDEGFCLTDARRAVYETTIDPDPDPGPDPGPDRTAAVRTPPVDD